LPQAAHSTSWLAAGRRQQYLRKLGDVGQQQ
jgi:hypothetical protein